MYLNWRPTDFGASTDKHCLLRERPFDIWGGGGGGAEKLSKKSLLLIMYIKSLSVANDEKKLAFDYKMVYSELQIAFSN